MKKQFALIGFALLAATQIASAQTNKFEGWSASAGIGYQSVNPKFDNVVNVTGNRINIGTTDSTGVTGNLSLDYTQKLSNTNVLTYGVDYALGEGGDKSVTANGAATTMQSRYKQNHRFYIAPGFLMDNDTLAYFKLGTGTATQTIKDNTTEKFDAKFYSYGAGVRVAKADGFFYFGELNVVAGTKKSSIAIDRTSLETKPTGYNLMFGIGKRF